MELVILELTVPRWPKRCRLRGISTGDFQEAPSALLGTDAPNLSPAVISRLTSSRPFGTGQCAPRVRSRQSSKCRQTAPPDRLITQIRHNSSAMTHRVISLMRSNRLRAKTVLAEQVMPAEHIGSLSQSDSVRPVQLNVAERSLKRAGEVIRLGEELLIFSGTT